MDSFWEYFWLVFACFAFAAYVVILFSILTDLFRDHRTSGWAKAVWVFFLFVLPIIGEMVYLIVRGRGMVERSARADRRYRAAEDAYIGGSRGRRRRTTSRRRNHCSTRGRSPTRSTASSRRVRAGSTDPGSRSRRVAGGRDAVLTPRQPPRIVVPVTIGSREGRLMTSQAYPPRR